MAHPTVFGGAMPPPASYQISNSVKCDSVRQTYFQRTQVAGNRKTLTISFWHKTTVSSMGGFFINSGVSYPFNQSTLHNGAAGHVTLTNYWSSDGGGVFQTYAQYRDPSAWQHFVVAIDTTQANAAARARLWVNGIENANLNSYSNMYTWAQGADTQWNSPGTTAWINNCANYDGYSDGYIAEFHLIDGQALSASNFGKLDANGVWVPIRYSGAYGANGCKLEFKNGAALGTDTSGNGNNWTVNGFVASDQMVDTPTNNYCTLNPLNKTSSGTASLSNGNMVFIESGGANMNCQSTIGFDPTTGPWYFEFKQGPSGTNILFGICQQMTQTSLNSGIVAASTGGVLWSSGAVFVNGVNSFSVSSLGANAVVGCLVKNGKVYMGVVSGGTITWENSGNPTDETGYLATGLSGTFFVTVGSSSSTTVTLNCGQTAFAISPVPSSAKALCTANLPAVAIPQPSKNFDVDVYSGDGTSSRIRSGFQFQPDLVWNKPRSFANSHLLYDAVRGFGTLKALGTDTTNAEGSMSDSGGFVSGVTSSGYTLSYNGTPPHYVNGGSDTYVTWLWKAGGAAVSNSAGTVTSQVSANPTAGISLMTFTGVSGGCTWGHGLGATPKMFWFKNRTGSADDFYIYHAALGAGSYLVYRTPAATVNANVFATPTSTTIGFGSAFTGPQALVNFSAVAFAEIPGYSKFGSYTGNGSTDGPFVYCGFSPGWLMVKRADSPGSWIIYDTSRNIHNVTDKYLLAESSQAEASPFEFDLLSNGFNPRVVGVSANASGGTYIFAAFAEHPFGGSNVSPSPAR